MKKQEIMKRAWELAREGQRKYGESTRVYFAQALIEAWKEARQTVTFAIMKETHQKMSWAKPHLAGCIEIPKLYDEMKKTLINLELKQLKERLIEWMNERKINLWVCNSPATQHRADDGIYSDRGLLYYVIIK